MFDFVLDNIINDKNINNNFKEILKDNTKKGV